MTLRIAFVYPHILCSGGYPRDFRWLAGALQKVGADITLFTLEADRPSNLFDGLAEQCSLAELSKTPLSLLDGFDIVHFFGFFWPHYLSYLYRLSKPVVVLSTLGHLMPLHLKVKRVKKALYIKTAGHFIRSKISVFHVFSKSEANSLSVLGGNLNYFVAPLGIYPVSGTRMQEAAAKKDNDGSFSVLFLGRNDVRQKGIDILLHGFALAIKQLNGQITLTIAGQPWKDSQERIKTLIDQLGITRHVRIMGSVSEETKHQLFTTHDYLCFLSRWDGPPRPIREAISVGTPVIISWETNMGELVTDTEAGLTVSLNNEHVAEAFVRIAMDKSLRSKHTAGIKILARRLSWTNVAKEWLAAYKEIGKSRRC